MQGEEYNPISTFKANMPFQSSYQSPSVYDSPSSPPEYLTGFKQFQPNNLSIGPFTATTTTSVSTMSSTFTRYGLIFAIVLSVIISAINLSFVLNIDDKTSEKTTNTINSAKANLGISCVLFLVLVIVFLVGYFNKVF